VTEIPLSVFQKFTLVDVRYNPTFDCERFQRLPEKIKYFIITSCINLLSREEKMFKTEVFSTVHPAEEDKIKMSTLARHLYFLQEKNSTFDSLGINFKVPKTTVYILVGLALGMTTLVLICVARKCLKKLCKQNPRNSGYENFNVTCQETDIDMNLFDMNNLSLSSEELFPGQNVTDPYSSRQRQFKRE
jgi:hypothetical protein